ncbi:MAG: cytochrome c3 family protein [Bacteroidetes bacterium]|nr:cytochrome c3 family protein [Bacteroidota bacterium]
MKKGKVFLIASALLVFLRVGMTQQAFAQNGIPSPDSVAAPAAVATGKTCIDCHGALVEKKIKHKTETEKGCADCHTPTTAEHPTAKVTLEKNVPDLCLSCHEEQKDLIKTSAYVHSAMKEPKSCVACHSPHSSAFKKLLVSSRKDLCLSCHNKAVVTKTKTTTNYEKLMKTSKTLHPPFEDCQKVCHSPHASNDSRLIDSPFPVNTYLAANSDSFGLCWECHGQDMIEKPKTKGATEFRNGETNLHFTHVSGDKARTCMICHNPHATSTDHLIREKVHFGSWDFNMNYAPDDSGGTCLPACHGQKRYTSIKAVE